jgi:hypothetical protein
MKDVRALSAFDAGTLLRRFQLNEWALDKRITKKAKKEQRAIIKELLNHLCWREVDASEVDYVLSTMN